MTNKTKTITGAAAVAATTLSILAGSIFVGNRYDAKKNAIQTDLADEYKTVLIFKGDDPYTGDIVYADQCDDTFEKSQEFLLRNKDLSTGKYTMFLGGSENGEVLRREFYITVNGLTNNGVIEVMGE